MSNEANVPEGKEISSDAFWKNIVDNIYTAENHFISNELLKIILHKLNECEDALNEHDSKHSPFYTSLVAFSALTLSKRFVNCKTHQFLVKEKKTKINLLSNIKDSIDQIIELEQPCITLIAYLIDYLSKQNSAGDEFKVISSVS